jgi:flavin reductase (DIM6/NTAB) family NADH-FMN oxidoreductase RutF
MAVDPHEFRSALGRFATGVTVVTVDGSGVDGIEIAVPGGGRNDTSGWTGDAAGWTGDAAGWTGDAAGWNAGAYHAITMSAFLSLSLEPPLVGVAIDHQARAYPAFLRARRCCVSILAAGQEEVSDFFAARPTSLVRPPLVPFHGLAAVDGAVAHLACRVVQRVPTGDHDLVVAAVEHVHVRDESPLLYFRSDYRSLV